MKFLSGKSTLLVAAILVTQHLSCGFPLRKDLTAAPKALEELIRRAPPIIRPEPEPVKGPTEGAPGSAAPENNPAGSADPPPRFGSNPAPEAAPPAAPAPKVATLGTEDELVAAGLKQGTPQREAFDRFANWFNNLKATQTETPWIFFTKLGSDATEPGGAELVLKFQDGFKAGKFRQDGDAPVQPTDNIQQMGQVMNPSDLPTQVGPVPAGKPLWYDMVASYGSARLAAVRGGNARILMPKDAADTPDNRFWTDFEAYELTKPGSNVQSIWRYNSANFDEAPTQMWKQGMPTIGKPANFDKTPSEAEDGLIDLGDF